MILGICLGFSLLELTSILMHKYLFHGPLWRIHRTHHRKTGPGVLELNDAFSLLFAVLGVTLLHLGQRGGGFVLGLGLGICAYGIGYFLVHDLMTHRRFVPLKPRGSVLTRLVRRHRWHHQRCDQRGQGPWGLFSGL